MEKIITPEMIEAKREEIYLAFSSRISREVVRGTALPDKLESEMKVALAPKMVEIACALEVDFSFVNKEQSSSQQFCEKAINRALVSLKGIAMNSAEYLNVMTRYFIKNASILASRGEDFTFELQSFTCSDKYTLKGKRPSGLSRHTIASQTARRQSGLTRQALIAVGAASVYKNGEGEDCLRVDLEHPLCALVLGEGK